MEDVKEELERSQLQLYQLLIELEQSHAELDQMRNELEESELLRKQMQVEMELMKSHLQETQGELEWVRGELDRYRYREAIATQTVSEREREYKLLVWDAWSAYRNGDISGMVDRLQRSLKYTSLSRTKTVSNWVKSWSEFSGERGERFEVRRLNGYQEWKQLLRRMTRIKFK